VILWVLSGLATERGTLTWGGVMSGHRVAAAAAAAGDNDNDDDEGND